MMLGEPLRRAPRVGLFAPSPSRFASLALGGSATIPLAQTH
jgi:hypothetical protein